MGSTPVRDALLAYRPQPRSHQRKEHRMDTKRNVLLAVAIFTLSLPAAHAQVTRVERDLLGEKAIPSDAYYGVQTARALENFDISGVLINHYPGFVEAWAIVKVAAARANADLGAMEPD